MRLLGIDVGEKKIGLALSDRLSKTSSPLTILANDKNIKKRLLDIIEKYEVGKIIIGIPYNLKGEIEHQAKRVQKFIKENLKSLAAENNIEIIMLDERFTSKLSDRILSLKTKKSRRNTGNDSIAAAILLNDYIERNKSI